MNKTELRTIPLKKEVAQENVLSSTRRKVLPPSAYSIATSYTRFNLEILIQVTKLKFQTAKTGEFIDITFRIYFAK
jgi:hypothetical protein